VTDYKVGQELVGLCWEEGNPPEYLNKIIRFKVLGINGSMLELSYEWDHTGFHGRWVTRIEELERRFLIPYKLHNTPLGQALL
jgi:hypothetical protein